MATGGSGRLHYQAFPTTNHFSTQRGGGQACSGAMVLGASPTLSLHGAPWIPPPPGATSRAASGQAHTKGWQGLSTQVCNINLSSSVSLGPPYRGHDLCITTANAKTTEHTALAHHHQPSTYNSTTHHQHLSTARHTSRSLPTTMVALQRLQHGINKEPSLVSPTCTQTAASPHCSLTQPRRTQPLPGKVAGSIHHKPPDGQQPAGYCGVSAPATSLPRPPKLDHSHPGACGRME